MEKNTGNLSRIGLHKDRSLSPIKSHQASLPHKSSQDNLRARKLNLEYKELLRKMEIQKKIDLKDEKTDKQLKYHKEVKEKKKIKRNVMNTSKTLDQIDEKVNGEGQKNELGNNREQFRQINKESNNCTVYEFPKKSKYSKEMLPQHSYSKQNLFKIYRINKKPSGLSTFHHENSPKAKQQPTVVNLIDFGIFSEHKNCQNFLKKIKINTEKQFVSGVNVNQPEDLTRFELILLRQFKNEGQLLDY